MPRETATLIAVFRDTVWMMAGDPGRLSWQEVSKWLPYAIVALVGVTATALVQVIGPVALIIIWLCVVIVGVLLFALQKHRESQSLRAELANESASPTSGTDLGRTGHLETQKAEQERHIQQLQQDKTQLAERLRTTEQKLAANEAMLQSVEDIPKQEMKESETVILDATIRVPVGEDYEVISRKMKRGSVEVLAESLSAYSFTLLVLDSENFGFYSKDKGYDSALAVSNVKQYRDTVKIPYADEWYFVIEATSARGNPAVRLSVRSL